MSLTRLIVAGSLVAVAIGAVAASHVDARTPRRLTPNIAGTWDSTYGEVSLTQTGNRISGQYPCCGGGTLEGRIVEGAVVKFRWSEPRGAGEGEGIWRIKGDGTLDGSWGHGQSDNDGSEWKLWRPRGSKQIAQ